MKKWLLVGLIGLFLMAFTLSSVSYFEWFPEGNDTVIRGTITGMWRRAIIVDSNGEAIAMFTIKDCGNPGIGSFICWEVPPQEADGQSNVYNFVTHVDGYNPYTAYYINVK